jgi:hypothetical protein
MRALTSERNPKINNDLQAVKEGYVVPRQAVMRRGKIIAERGNGFPSNLLVALPLVEPILRPGQVFRPVA